MILIYNDGTCEKVILSGHPDGLGSRSRDLLRTGFDSCKVLKEMPGVLRISLYDS